MGESMLTAHELIRALPYDERAEAERDPIREVAAARIADAHTAQGIAPNPWHHYKPRLRAMYRVMARAALGAAETVRKNEAGGFYAAIAHGDAEHRDWLREACDAWFSGKPVPAPRGKGTA